MVTATIPVPHKDFHDVQQIQVNDASRLHHLYFAQYLATVLEVERHFSHTDTPHAIPADSDQNLEC